MLWVKTFHIILIASWFAGLFYLPRIFVNLAMETEPAATARLLLMARKLYPLHDDDRGARAGLRAVAVARDRHRTRPGLDAREADGRRAADRLSLLLRRLLATFERGENRRSHKWYRMFNELPVLGMLAAVALVVIKPF